MLPSPNDLSELDSVEVTEPQETQTDHKCNKLSVDVCISQNGPKVMAFLKRNALVVLTMAGVALGIVLGSALRHINMTARDVQYLTFPGELLMRLLQMMVLPLTISSVITGISSVDKKAYGKIGLRAFCYYMVTTFIAAFTGIALAVLIQPGESSTTASVSSSGHRQAVQTVDSFLDLIRNMIPSNLVEACFRKYQSGYSGSVDVVNVTRGNNHTVPVPGTADGANILGLLCFSVGFGLILGSMGTEGKPLRDFFDCLNKAIIQLVNIFIWYTPVGIFFLLTGQILKMTDIGEIGREVAMYTLTIITGLLIHGLLTLPLIYFVVTRKNPFRFIGGVLQALTTAFGTASSSATLPVTIYCMEENHNMDKRVTRFLLPIGATLNMDGGALYEAVAALFIAQIHKMDFDVGKIIFLSLIITAASTSAAGIPQTGMVNMMIVLQAAGLPDEDISLLIMVDWILDRLRTPINVLGDCIGVSVVQHLSRHELQRSTPAEKSLVEESSQI